MLFKRFVLFVIGASLAFISGLNLTINPFDLPTIGNILFSSVFCVSGVFCVFSAVYRNTIVKGVECNGT